MALLELDLDPRPKVLRAFGIGALVFFGALAGLGAASWDWPQAAWLPVAAVGLLSGAFALARPSWNRPLYLLLTVACYPLGLVASYVVLAIIFYVVLTPVGLVFRLIGRDALRRRRPREATTYWIARSGSPAPERYFRQF